MGQIRRSRGKFLDFDVIKLLQLSTYLYYITEKRRTDSSLMGNGICPSSRKRPEPPVGQTGTAS